MTDRERILGLIAMVDGLMTRNRQLDAEVELLRFERDVALVDWELVVPAFDVLAFDEGVVN